MFNLDKTIKSSTADFDSNLEFWPSQAEKFLNQKEFDKVVDLCRQNLPNNPNLLSARLIYARALTYLKRDDEAIEQLYQVLSIDPDNVVALKILGDIRYGQEDVVSAMASYSRILEIDPECRGIKSDLPHREVEKEEETKKLVLQRAPEMAVPVNAFLIERPFRTETVGDLYLAQGQPRLAMEIFKELSELHQNPRLREKLTNAEKMVAQKERRDVDQKN